MKRFLAKMRDRRPRGYSGSFRPRLEGLEDRCCPTTVTSLDDSGPGTLREAIAITEPGGTVDFQDGLTGTITLAFGPLTINKDLTIVSPEADFITVSGGHRTRVFNIAPTFNVVLSAITIADGESTASSGGGILNGGNLTVIDSIITGNQILATVAQHGAIDNSGTMNIIDCVINNNLVQGVIVSGGAIYNTGTMAITDTMISNNSAHSFVHPFVQDYARGGAIDNHGTLTITTSTFNNNSVVSQGGSTVDPSGGGGVYNSGTLSITNSTFNGNSVGPIGVSSGGGGALYNAGSLTMTSSTFSENSVSGTRMLGGGLFLQSAASMRNTIVAGNTAGTGYRSDIQGYVNSAGHNLVGVYTDGLVDSDLVGLDPQLQPLGDYGGPTLTMRPLPTSPAVDTGDNSNPPDTDQRGLTRIVNGFIDIGAVELQPDEITNLIRNGGFERGDFTAWTQSGNLDSTYVDNSMPHSGNFAANLGPVGSEGFLAQTFSTNPGATYTLTYWLQHDGGSPSSFHAMIDGGDIPGSVLIDPAAFDYTQYTFSFTATGSSTELKFGFREDPANFHLDDISVCLAAGPGTPSGAVFFLHNSPAVVRADFVLQPQGLGRLIRPLAEASRIQNLDHYFVASLATESDWVPNLVYDSPQAADGAWSLTKDFDLDMKFP